MEERKLEREMKCDARLLSGRRRVMDQEPTEPTEGPTDLPGTRML
jgi:hypothetical protein